MCLCRSMEFCLASVSFILISLILYILLLNLNDVFQWVNLFRKKKYVYCPVRTVKRKYHAFMLSSTQFYELKSLCQQHHAGYQTKEIFWTGAEAVSGTLSCTIKKSLSLTPLHFYSCLNRVYSMTPLSKILKWIYSMCTLGERRGQRMQELPI